MKSAAWFSRTSGCDFYYHRLHMITDRDVLTFYGPVVPVFQPIIDLRNGDIVAFEALARWPDSPDSTPDEVFAAAAARGSTADLDLLCLRAAMTSAIAVDADLPWTLFVNVEPEDVSRPGSRESVAELGALIRSGGPNVRIVVEFSERSLLTDPARLLRAADELRSTGAGIALDDVGADPASLVILPLLAPEVIKLDRSLLADTLDGARLETLLAVLSYAARTHVELVAEGIETESHHDRAKAWGASYGQGFRLGEPAGLINTPAAPFPVRPHTTDVLSIPDMIDEHCRESTTLILLITLLDQLLEFARTTMESLTVVVRFSRPELCTDEIAHKMRGLAERHPYVEAVNAPASMFTEADSVRTAVPEESSPAFGSVVVIGQRFYCALIARPDHDPADASPEGRWSYFFTADPALACSAARTIIVDSRPQIHSAGDR